MPPAPTPAPPSRAELEAEAMGCVIEVGLAGIAGAAPPPPAVVVAIDDEFSTAVGEDEATEAGEAGTGAGIEVDVLLLFETTAPARSHGFGGEGIVMVGSRFCGVPG